jgi:hypothetical protein
VRNTAWIAFGERLAEVCRCVAALLAEKLTVHFTPNVMGLVG